MSATLHRLVGFAECCRRLDISVRTGHRLLDAGKFPVPEQRRATPLSPHKFSTVHIDAYLADEALADAKRTKRRRAA